MIPLRVAEYMDTSTQFIVHMEVVDSREVEWHSPAMEKHFIDRGISFLVNRLPFIVWEVGQIRTNFFQEMEQGGVCIQTSDFVRFFQSD